MLCLRHGCAIGSTAVQLLGGHGYTKASRSSWYRDLRTAGVYEGALLVYLSTLTTPSATCDKPMINPAVA